MDLRRRHRTIVLCGGPAEPRRQNIHDTLMRGRALADVEGDACGADTTSWRQTGLHPPTFAGFRTDPVGRAVHVDLSDDVRHHARYTTTHARRDGVYTCSATCVAICDTRRAFPTTCEKLPHCRKRIYLTCPTPYTRPHTHTHTHPHIRPLYPCLTPRVTWRRRDGGSLPCRA